MIIYRRNNGYAIATMIMNVAKSAGVDAAKALTYIKEFIPVLDQSEERLRNIVNMVDGILKNEREK